MGLISGESGEIGGIDSVDNRLKELKMDRRGILLHFLGMGLML